MSVPQQDPNNDIEKRALQGIRFAKKDTGPKDERTQKLDSFLRTLGPERPFEKAGSDNQAEERNKSENTNPNLKKRSREKLEGGTEEEPAKKRVRLQTGSFQTGSETLNGRRAKDDIGVSYGGRDSLQHEAKDKLQIEQQRRGYNSISNVLDIDDRLKRADKNKLTDDYMKDRGVDPNEFRYIGKKLHKYLKDDLEGKMVSSIDYEIAHKKFSRMVKKLGDIDKRLGESPF